VRIALSIIQEMDFPFLSIALLSASFISELTRTPNTGEFAMLVFGWLCWLNFKMSYYVLD
jgi:hypothetical protein